ncbi:MAG: hypothetical protein KDK62_05570 [Chlamydiia bacterium]|nr:hypothetical protein [Chlamydiia bacterium]
MKDEFRFIISSDLDFEEMVIEITCEAQNFTGMILQENGLQNLEFWIDLRGIPPREYIFNLDSFLQALEKGKSMAITQKNPEGTPERPNNLPCVSYEFLQEKKCYILRLGTEICGYVTHASEKPQKIFIKKMVGTEFVKFDFFSLMHCLEKIRSFRD